MDSSSLRSIIVLECRNKNCWHNKKQLMCSNTQRSNLRNTSCKIMELNPEAGCKMEVEWWWLKSLVQDWLEILEAGWWHILRYVPVIMATKKAPPHPHHSTLVASYYRSAFLVSQTWLVSCFACCLSLVPSLCAAATLSREHRSSLQ